MDRETAIQTVVEDIESRQRVSWIRQGLANAGFSPDEIQEIIAEALEQLKTGREERREAGREPAIAVFALGILIAVVTYLLGGWKEIYIGPVCLFSYGAYLWYGKPRGRDDQQ